jgi:hypothetical protein
VVHGAAVYPAPPGRQPQGELARGPVRRTFGPRRGRGITPAMEFILWLIAVVLVIGGVVTLVRGAVLQGIVLIVVGLLVGPGGVSVFT